MAVPITIDRMIDRIVFHNQHGLFTNTEAGEKILSVCVSHYSPQGVREVLARVPEKLRPEVREAIGKHTAVGFDRRMGRLGQDLGQEQREAMFQRDHLNYEEIARLVDEVWGETAPGESR